jgi:phage-related minor tail protein
MLIDYVTAQAIMAGIAPEKIAEMTGKLADQYGVQQSLADASFGEFTRSMDAWVASGGENTDAHLADLQRITDETVALERETNRIRGEMVAKAKADYDAGKIDIDEYADELVKIEVRAKAAAKELLGIPTSITSTVTFRQVGAPPDLTGRSPAQGRAFDVNARASGGPVRAGAPYLVGEEGPELVIPQTNGVVLPAGLTQSLAQAPAAAQAQSQRGGGSLSITINNPMVDTAARLAELRESILSAAREASEQMFGAAVDGFILGNGAAR